MSIQIWLFFGILTVVASVSFCIYFYCKTRRTLDGITKMLDAAIDGSFTESTYNESRVSSIEAKLKQWIAQSIITSNQLELEQDKIKSIISDISHQTKTPIANISIYSELLLEQKVSEESKEYLRLLQEQSQKLSFLIHALIKSSRLETGVVAIQKKQCEVRTLIEEVCQQSNQKAAQKSMKMQCILEPMKVSIDKKWTKEAIYNIIDNAIKYGEEHSSIVIKGTVYELFYRIDITNQGFGILEEETNQIFSRFYRSQRVSDQEGVGLGLYLAREIISKQGGYIKVSSQLEKETTFSVFLRQEL